MDRIEYYFSIEPMEIGHMLDEDMMVAECHLIEPGLYGIIARSLPY